MGLLLKNIRFYIVCFSILLSVAIYLWAYNTIPGQTLQIIRLTQLYALTAVTYLYLTLLAGPFCYMFRWVPYRSYYIKSRRALGVSAWYFGTLHACFAFFGQLGGFAGLGFLNGKYLLAIAASFTALVILTLMAATAFDTVIAKLTFPRWKLLHRCVYLAGILLIIHALMLGTHFQQLNEWIPQVFFVALTFLLFLELLRVDAFLKKKLPKFPLIHVFSMPLFGLLLYAIFYMLYPLPDKSNFSFGIHSQHIQIARESQEQLTVNNSQLTNPNLRGDKTKRYTVSFNYPGNVQPNQDTKITFQVFDAASGNTVQFFQTIYEKKLHLIVVDSALEYFTHIHPELTENGFMITTQFPTSDLYHLYLNFQPLGAIEQQFAFTLPVGNITSPELSQNPPDKQLTKTFDDYIVALQVPFPLKATELSIGKQLLTFTITDAQTKEPVKNLKPYLAAFGHLVMINQKSYEYIHVHPNSTTIPKENESGGPTVEFLPLGLYGPIKSGIYRMFAQFNPNGQLMLVDFTVKVE